MDGSPFVRIRSKMKQYHNGKGVKRYHRLVLTIPSRFKEVVKPFMDKDLVLNVKRKDDSIIIEAKAVDASHNSS